MRVLIIQSFFLISIFNCEISYAQKIEKEKKISENQFPENARQYLKQNYPEKLKVKYYLEKSKSNTYYECKFFCKGSHYSIKFYEDGTLYDTEKVINQQEIAQDTWSKIKSTFDEDFKRWKIYKIQMRWYKQTIEYEIMVEGKLKNRIQPFEYNFSDDGKVLQKQLIDSRISNIMF